MTDQEISQMSPAQVNEAVARKLGWTVLSGGTLGVPSNAIDDAAERIPDYCHSIEAAWEIVGKFMSESGWDFNLLGGERYGGDWQANFTGHDQWHSAESDTAPMAICLAFLKLQ